MKIALVHYAFPPVIGGVERVVQQQAALFARRGHAVKVVCGSGDGREAGASEVGIVVVPELVPGHPACTAAQEAAGEAEGADRPEFALLRRALAERFAEEFAGCDVVLVHNLFTMPFNLAATAAIRDVAGGAVAVPGAGRPRIVNWVHDVAAASPDYHFPHIDSFPWSLLRSAPPGVESVCVSESRRAAFCAVTGADPDRCMIVPDGVEPGPLLGLTPSVDALAKDCGLFERDLVLLHPARILRRKNIAFGIRVAGELKRRGRHVLHLVTGAPDPYNTDSRVHGEELERLVRELDLADDVVFVGARFRVTDEDVRALYAASDLLILPSLQEGFGIPLLEAAVTRIPAFCPAIEPLCTLLEDGVHCFASDEPPGAVAELIEDVLAGDPRFLARREAIRKYSWDGLYERVIAPILAEQGEEHRMPDAAAPPRDNAANAVPGLPSRAGPVASS